MYIEHSLYKEVLKVMPIPCVDVILYSQDSRVLLLLRKNEPAAGQWWFPGGRVLFGEKRLDAAKRKINEECGLLANQIHEIGTFELFFDVSSDVRVHSITTLFSCIIESYGTVQIDSQSDEALWLTPREWLDYKLSPFIYDSICAFIANVEIAKAK